AGFVFSSHRGHSSLLLGCDCGDHVGDVAPFPARRSSVLAEETEKLAAEAVDVTALPSRWTAGARHPLTLLQEQMSDIFVGMGWRSEEHTCELQSRENLVCRLLREKKKRTHPRVSHVLAAA